MPERASIFPPAPGMAVTEPTARSPSPMYLAVLGMGRPIMTLAIPTRLPWAT